MREPGVVTRARDRTTATALVAGGRSWTYGDLLAASARGAGRLTRIAAAAGEPPPGARVGLLASPGFWFTAALWAIWRAGGVAVPLSSHHPVAELERTLDDSGASALVTGAAAAERLGPVAAGLGLAALTTDELLAEGPPTEPASPELPAPELSPPDGPAEAALIVYTSGTTSRPKGVVWTHAALEHQLATLVEAWGWRPDDRALHVLPLHHVHGLINVLGCSLWSGAACEMLDGFDAARVWDRLAGGEVTVFMAVPTIYHRLIATWEAADPSTRTHWSRGAADLRLMVSGSAALPEETLERWRELTGHTLLERYGMTEIGMALSNPLEGERIPGAVGRPLPGVETRLVDEEGCPLPAGSEGALEVRGPSVFREYWRRPEATAEAFRDGWFRTGDVASVDGEGVYRILGRSSVDIIKCGGYKVSALEVEAALLRHPDIAECAVVGLEDQEWGERIAAAVVLRPGARAPELKALRSWGKSRIAGYKLPSRLAVFGELPRNPLGKVVKPELREILLRALAGEAASEPGQDDAST